MTDRYQNHTPGLESPASHAFSVTPDDSNDLTDTTRAIYVGLSGDLRLTLLSGATVTLRNVASGTVLPLRATRILQTETTAAHLVGLL